MSSYKHTFDQDGNFASGAGSVESQVVTTVATLGELAGSLLNLGILDITSSFHTLREEIEDSSNAECKEIHQTNMFSSYPPTKKDTVSAAIVKRWRTYRTDGERERKGDGDSRVLKRIHFTSDQERQCFVAIRADISDANSLDLTRLRQEFENLLSEFESTHRQNPSFLDAKDEIARLTLEGSHAQLETRFNELNDSDHLNYDDTTFGAFRRLLLQRASRIAKKDDTNSFITAVLDAIIDVRPSIWRARQALELVDRIERSSVEAARFPPGPIRNDYKNFVAKLKEELDHILGTTHTSTQITNLEAYLAKEIPLRVGANIQRYSVDDREKVALQLKTLRQYHENQLSLVVGMNEPIPNAMGPISQPSPEPCPCPSLAAPSTEQTAEPTPVEGLVIPVAETSFVELTGKDLPSDPPLYILVVESAGALPKLTSLEVTGPGAEGEE